MHVKIQLPLLLSVLIATSCTSDDARDDTYTFGDGDGDITGDGDGDTTGDGDTDTTGDGDTDGDTDTTGDGDTDGDTDTTGDGDTTGDACDGACLDDEECVDDLCVPLCAQGEIVCEGGCIDPLTDMGYCGAVGNCLGQDAGESCDPTPANLCDGALGETCQAGVCGQGCVAGMQSFAFTGEIEELVLPECVVQIHVFAAGAQGGSSSNGSAGGMGAQVEGDLCVAPGTTLSVLVGEQAGSAPRPCGGGGGSFVVDDGQTPLFIGGGGGGGYNTWDAGGAATDLAQVGPGVGGGAYNDGGGGGGFSTDGQGTDGSGGLSFSNGGAGGVAYPLNNPNISDGGFGGGGGSSQSGSFNSGGGGGYDGGDAGNGNAATGGTSWFDEGADNTTFTPASQAGHGNVEITW